MQNLLWRWMHLRFAGEILHNEYYSEIRVEQGDFAEIGALAKERIQSGFSFDPARQAGPEKRC